MHISRLYRQLASAYSLFWSSASCSLYQWEANPIPNLSLNDFPVPWNDMPTNGNQKISLPGTLCMKQSVRVQYKYWASSVLARKKQTSSLAWRISYALHPHIHFQKATNSASRLDRWAGTGAPLPTLIDRGKKSITFADTSCYCNSEQAVAQTHMQIICRFSQWELVRLFTASTSLSFYRYLRKQHILSRIKALALRAELYWNGQTGISFNGYGSHQWDQDSINRTRLADR